MTDDRINIEFTVDELNTIDVTLRQRAMMISLELQDEYLDQYRIAQLNRELERIMNILESHSIFREFKQYYQTVLDQ